MKYFLLLTILFFAGTYVVQAQSDTADFRISVFGGSDIIPPTTPTLLTAVPVAPSQIDLTWSSSTDNFLVSGYVLSRDGFDIATTTLLNYSDTDLSASTTYLYTVRAFDPSLNYSSSSNSLSTTTPNVPVPIPVAEEPSRSGTAIRVVLNELRIETGETTTALSIKTATPSRLELRWGRTTAYELGYIVGSIYRSEHTFSLSALEPNTTYVFELVGYTPRGGETILKTGSFTTKSDAPSTPPINVSRFVAIADNNDVLLSWQNPADRELSHVRIVRSHLGYPANPTDGAIVYQGLGTSVKDENILSIYSPVYYTAFVYDSFGNVSSGAIAMAFLSSNQIGGSSGIKIPGLPEGIDDSYSVINQERVTVDMKLPELSDITIEQNKNKFTMLEAPVLLSGQDSFVVSINTKAVAGNLKSIILSVVDPTDNRQVYSYLLRMNNDRTAYVATVPALNVLGKSQLKVEVYDYEAFVVGTYQTPIEFTTLGTEERGGQGTIYSIIATILFIASGLLILILIILVLYLGFKRRKRRDEDK